MKGKPGQRKSDPLFSYASVLSEHLQVLKENGCNQEDGQLLQSEKNHDSKALLHKISVLLTQLHYIRDPQF